MTLRSTAARALGVLVLSVPVSVSLLAVGTPAALASGSYSSPTPAAGAVLTTDRFTVQAAITAGSDSVTLTVTGTASGATSPFCTASTSSSGGPLSGAQTLQLSFPAASGPCSAVRNAQWLANLSGGASGSRSFTTNAAPATPSSFSAQGSGARDVSFSWSKGTEADLSGYALYDGSGALLDGAIDLSHCSGSSCAYGLYYPSDNAGSHTYQLSALRASGGCSSCGSTVESVDKASATATLVNPPKPTPSPTPSPAAAPAGSPAAGGSSTGGTSGGTTSGGSTTGGSTTGSSTGAGSGTGGTSTAVKPGPTPTLPALADPILAARNAFALQFNAFAPSLGIPKLPPLPATALPSFSEGPLPAGTYKPTLPYQPRTSTVKTTSVLSQPIAAVRDVLDSAQLIRSIAAAFILLLAAAHLRRFLGTHVDE